MAKSEQSKLTHLAKFTDITAPIYDLSVRLFLGRENDFRQTVIDLMHLTGDESVLDVGCGTGTLTSMIAKKMNGKGSILGIDISPRMIEVARKKAGKQGQQVEYKVASCLALPFDNETFDVAVSSLVYHQLMSWEERTKTVSEIQRVLKPGGRYVAAEFTKFTARNLWVVHDSMIRKIPLFGPELVEESGFHILRKVEAVKGITIISATRGSYGGRRWC